MFRPVTVPGNEEIHGQHWREGASGGLRPHRALLESRDTPIAPALGAAGLQVAAGLGAGLVDAAGHPTVGAAQVNAGAVLVGRQAVLAEMTRHDLLENVFATIALPAHQVLGADEHATIARVMTADPAGQTVRHILGDVLRDILADILADIAGQILGHG